MAFSRQQDDIVILRPPDGGKNGVGAVEIDLRDDIHASHDLIGNGLRIFDARVVVGHDNAIGKLACDPAHGGTRSEEHTSDLQSLMRNSSAVFSLKKQK